MPAGQVLYFRQALKKHQQFVILGYPETLKIELPLVRELNSYFSHRTRKRHQKDLQNAPLGAQMPLLGRFGGRPKI